MNRRCNTSSDHRAHRLGRHADSTTRSLVKATMKRLAKRIRETQEAGQGASFDIGV